jgi:hypothetical protein
METWVIPSQKVLDLFKKILLELDAFVISVRSSLSVDLKVKAEQSRRPDRLLIPRNDDDFAS